jgi:hypothetical protein
MARPVGWLARLDPITRSGANSVRSHYDGADMTALPKVHVGRPVLVERDALLAFLERKPAKSVPQIFKRGMRVCDSSEPEIVYEIHMLSTRAAQNPTFAA